MQSNFLRISIVSAFSRGRAKTIQLRYMWTSTVSRYGVFLQVPERGYSWDFLVGVCRPLLQIVTLFQTKKFNFSDPFSDQTSKIHTRFQTWPLDKDYVIIT